MSSLVLVSIRQYNISYLKKPKSSQDMGRVYLKVCKFAKNEEK